MKRTPLRPSTKPIARSAYPPLGKPPRARKKDPAKRRFAKHRCEPFLAWLREQRCCITGKRTGECYAVAQFGSIGFGYIHVDPAHTTPRSLGADDLYECIPLARHLHEEQERIGWPAFEKKYGINRKALAKKYTEEFLAGLPAYEAGAPPKEET